MAGWGVMASDAGNVGYGAQVSVPLMPPNGSMTVWPETARGHSAVLQR